MKKKKIEKIVSSCCFCEYRHGRTCTCADKIIKNNNTIPNWCPLEDYKEADHEAPA